MPTTGSEIHFNFGIQESFNNITKDGNTILFYYRYKKNLSW